MTNYFPRVIRRGRRSTRINEAHYNFRKAITSDVHPRHIFARASLRQGLAEDEEPKAAAPSESWGDSQKALDNLRSMGEAAQTGGATGAGRGRGNARY